MLRFLRSLLTKSPPTDQDYVGYLKGVIDYQNARIAMLEGQIRMAHQSLREMEECLSRQEQFRCGE